MDKYPEFERILDSLADEYGGITRLVSGGAKGGDRYAEIYAKNRNIQITIHYPEWDKYGKSAGFRRNLKIVEDADIVVAVWDGESKGTRHTITEARKSGKKVIVYQFQKERS